MMNLRKNDRIIIIIGVAVFAIALIAIALYQPPLPLTTQFSDLTKTKTYEVEWDIKESNVKSISEFVGKREVFEITESINRANLKSVRFNLSWVDDKALLGRFGLDTLTLEVVSPDGTVLSDYQKSQVRTKEGNVEIVFRDITRPIYDAIEATSEVEAQEILNEHPYYNTKWKGDDFTIQVTVDVGEILGNIRPRDKGNSFDLKITCEYYEPSLVLDDQNKTTSDDTSPTENKQENTWKWSDIVNLSMT